jgi:O-antigen ligase
MNTKHIDDTAYVAVLFVTYIIYMSYFYFFNVGPVNELFYLYLAPVAFLPFRWKMVKTHIFSLPLPATLSLDNLKRSFSLCLEPLPFILFIYVINKAILTLFLPNIDLLITGELIKGFIPLLAYFIITIRLCVDVPGFYEKYFAIMGPVVSINALINIYIYLHALPSLDLFENIRLSPSFGSGVNTNAPTAAALTYAIHVYGLFILLLQNKYKKLIFLYFVSTLILLVPLLLTQTRGSIIALVLALAFTFLIDFKNKYANMKILSLILCAIASFFVFTKAGAFAYSRGDNQRLEIWVKFLEVIKNQSILGCGDRDFINGKLFEIVVNSGEHIHHAHNILINALWRGGLIGFISLAAILVFGAYNSFLYYMTKKDPIPLGLLIILTIAGMVDVEFHITPVTWLWTTAWLPLLFVVSVRTKSNTSVSPPCYIQLISQISRIVSGAGGGVRRA